MCLIIDFNKKVLQQSPKNFFKNYSINILLLKNIQCEANDALFLNQEHPNTHRKSF